MSPNSLNFSPFTAVTGSYMLVPHPILSPNRIPTSSDTLKVFVDEMQSMNFYDFASGDCHTIPNSYVPNDLHHTPQVWLRIDRVRKSLEAPYSGPYEVVKRFPKFFILKLPQGETSVSIDRLKPAYLLNNSPPSAINIPRIPPPIVPLTTSTHDPPSPVVESSDNRLHDNLESTPRTTRSGRNVRFNKDAQYLYF